MEIDVLWRYLLNGHWLKYEFVRPFLEIVCFSLKEDFFICKLIDFFPNQATEKYYSYPQNKHYESSYMSFNDFARIRPS